MTKKEKVGSSLELVIKETNLKVPFKVKTDNFQMLAKIIIFDSNRNRQIIDDIKTEANSGKRCLVLTERKELDRKIAKLAKALKSSNTTIIITADHGLVNTSEENKIIKLENHPELVETLLMPLSGEPRVVYCYVKPSKVKQFENYVKTRLASACEMHKSEELIRKNYFGLYKPNEKLKERVGDYTLIMKENYIMKDLVLGEDQNIFVGNHGGVSREEMIVSLIVA